MYLAIDGMKMCRTCKQVLSVEMFVVDRSRKDGLLGDCKPCKKVKLEMWRAAKPGYNVKHVAKFKRNNPEKVKAHKKAQRALKKGRITWMPCSVCGSANSEMHHEDYSLPLEVIWFCRLHHAEYHARKRKACGM